MAFPPLLDTIFTFSANVIFILKMFFFQSPPFQCPILFINILFIKHKERKNRKNTGFICPFNGARGIHGTHVMCCSTELVNREYVFDQRMLKKPFRHLPHSFNVMKRVKIKVYFLFIDFNVSLLFCQRRLL